MAHVYKKISQKNLDALKSNANVVFIDQIQGSKKPSLSANILRNEDPNIESEVKILFSDDGLTLFVLITEEEFLKEISRKEEEKRKVEEEEKKEQLRKMNQDFLLSLD